MAPPADSHRHPARPTGPLALDARHRAHARVEDRIRTGKDTGFGRFPSRVFAINAAWLQLALTGIDLLAWMQALLLDGALAGPNRRSCRHRILHTAARITRGGRQTRLRIAAHWPWAEQLAAFLRLAALPRPITNPTPPACSDTTRRNPEEPGHQRRASGMPRPRHAVPTTPSPYQHPPLSGLAKDGG